MAEFNLDTVKKDTLAQMGNETVPVEIEENGLVACANRTLEILGRYKPLIRHESYTVGSPGVHAHECDPEVKGVSSIDLTPTNKGTFSSMAIESAMLSGQPVFYSTTDTFLDIQYFDERLRWIKTAQRELGSDPDYAYVMDPDTGIWSIYTFGSVGLWVDATVVLEYDPKFTNIPLHLRNWTANWYRTEVMKVVGRVRGKFDKIPVAGGFMSMDGPRLMAEATAEQKTLLEFIQGSRADLFPRWC